MFTVLKNRVWILEYESQSMRVVGLRVFRTLHSRWTAPQPRSRTRADKPKNFLPFLCTALPPTPPPKGEKRKGSFWFASPNGGTKADVFQISLTGTTANFAFGHLIGRYPFVIATPTFTPLQFKYTHNVRTVRINQTYGQPAYIFIST